MRKLLALLLALSIPAYAEPVKHKEADSIAGIAAPHNLIKIGSGDAGKYLGSWSGYDDTNEVPTDCTGGTPAGITMSRVAGATDDASGYKFRMAKDASDRQGMGFAYDFKVPITAQGKTVALRSFFDGNANFTFGDSSDVKVYIYDKDTPKLITPNSNALPADSDWLETTFNIPTGVDDLRLCLHVATTSASTWQLDFDDLEVSRRATVNGLAGTDWISFTPTGTWTTNTDYEGRFRRVGDSMEVYVEVLLNGGAPNAADLFIDMPSGYTIDTSKLVSTTQANVVMPESGVSGADAGVRNYTGGHTIYWTTTRVRPFLDNGDNQVLSINQTSPHSWNDGDYVIVAWTAPIVGWSAGVQMLDQPVDVWGVSVWSGVSTDSVTGGSWTVHDDASFSGNVTREGSATAPSTATNLGHTINNIPPGDYEVVFSAPMRTDAVTTICHWAVFAGSTIVASTIAATSASNDRQDKGTISGFVHYDDHQSSVEFLVKAERTTGSANCSILSLGGSKEKWTLVFRPVLKNGGSIGVEKDKSYNMSISTTTGPSISTTHEAIGIPYQVQNGTWWMHYNLFFDLTSTTTSSIVVAISGVSIEAGSSQPCSVFLEEIGVSNPLARYAVAGTNGVTVLPNTATNYDRVALTCHSRLDAKPTFVP